MGLESGVSAEEQIHKGERAYKILTILRDQGVFIALLILTLFLSLSTHVFFTLQNLINVLRQTSEVAIGAAGMTLVILLAGIDLSVGSILAISGVAAAILSSQIGWFPALLIALIIGLAIGLLNGFFITKWNITAIITTLAMMTVIRGAVYIWTNGTPVYRGLPLAFSFIGRGYVGPVPIPVIIMFGVYAILYFLLNNTVFGRYIYAIGGNPEAARLSGVSVKKYTVYAYMISGLCAAIAGVIVLGRLNSAQPIAGSGYELDVITAVALGGVALSGGKGSVVKVLIGSFIMAMLSNGLVLMNVTYYTQMMIKGLVLLLAVGFDMFMHRLAKSR